MIWLVIKVVVICVINIYHGSKKGKFLLVSAHTQKKTDLPGITSENPKSKSIASLYNLVYQ